MSIRVDDIELLRLTAPILAEAVGSSLRDREAANFAENQVFFETIRTQFRVLARYLDNLAEVRSPTDSWPQLKDPLKNVTWKINDAIWPAVLRQGLAQLDLESPVSSSFVYL